MDGAPTRLTRLPLGERLKLFGLSLIVPALVAGVGSKSETAWVETASYGVAVLVAVALGWWSMRQMAATCPLCGKRLETAAVTAADENVRVECEHCFEWLISHAGALRAFGADDVPGPDGFTAPVFEGTRWPSECVACAAPATHLTEAKARTVHLAAAVAGKLASSSASLDGIPVCDAHDGAVSLEIEQLGAVRLVFPTFAARRRYVSRHQGMIPATIARS